jgi:hypothetical protein
MKRFVALALLLAGACKHGRPGDPTVPAPQPVQLCIQNETVAFGNVIAYAGQTRYDVMSGHQVCKPIHGPAPYLPLRATTTSGGANGPRVYSARLRMTGERCWQWRLSDAPASPGDLQPCDEATEARASSRA